MFSKYFERMRTLCYFSVLVHVLEKFLCFQEGFGGVIELKSAALCLLSVLKQTPGGVVFMRYYTSNLYLIDGVASLVLHHLFCP